MCSKQALVQQLINGARVRTGFWYHCFRLQVKLENLDGCLDALFLFSLVWSIGATCDSPSANKFEAFLRQLLARKVDAGAERTDFDLGPGLVINYPERLLGTQVPEVGNFVLCNDLLGNLLEQLANIAAAPNANVRAYCHAAACGWGPAFASVLFNPCTITK